MGECEVLLSHVCMDWSRSAPLAGAHACGFVWLPAFLALLLRLGRRKRRRRGSWWRRGGRPLCSTSLSTCSCCSSHCIPSGCSYPDTSHVGCDSMLHRDAPPNYLADAGSHHAVLQ